MNSDRGFVTQAFLDQAVRARKNEDELREPPIDLAHPGSDEPGCPCPKYGGDGEEDLRDPACPIHGLPRMVPHHTVSEKGVLQQNWTLTMMSEGLLCPAKIKTAGEDLSCSLNVGHPPPCCPECTGDVCTKTEEHLRPEHQLPTGVTVWERLSAAVHTGARALTEREPLLAKVMLNALSCAEQSLTTDALMARRVALWDAMMLLSETLREVAPQVDAENSKSLHYRWEWLAKQAANLMAEAGRVEGLEQANREAHQAIAKLKAKPPAVQRERCDQRHPELRGRRCTLGLGHAAIEPGTLTDEEARAISRD